MALIVALASGCAPLQAETRIERGPLLDTFSRKVELPGHVLTAEVEPAWPRLRVRFQRLTVCREETVEVFAEELITERRGSAAPQMLTSGLVNSFLGGALIVARGAFSGEPDRSRIDAEGRYGPSTQQVVTGVGVGLLVLGLPSAVAGAITLARAGEERAQRRVEEVASLSEGQCGSRSTAGSAELLLSPGAEPVPARPLSDGTLTLSAEELQRLPVRAFLLEGEVAVLSEEDEAALAAFRRCARVMGASLPAEPPVTDEVRGQVGELLGLARRCERELPEVPAEERVRALEALLAAPESPAPPPP